MQVTRNENGSKAVRIGASYSESDQRTNTVNGMEFLNSTGAIVTTAIAVATKKEDKLLRCDMKF